MRELFDGDGPGLPTVLRRADDAAEADRLALRMGCRGREAIGESLGVSVASLLLYAVGRFGSRLTTPTVAADGSVCGLALHSRDGGPAEYRGRPGLTLPASLLGGEAGGPAVVVTELVDALLIATHAPGVIAVVRPEGRGGADLAAAYLRRAGLRPVVLSPSARLAGPAAAPPDLATAGPASEAPAEAASRPSPPARGISPGRTSPRFTEFHASHGGEPR